MLVVLDIKEIEVLRQTVALITILFALKCVQMYLIYDPGLY